MGKQLIFVGGTSGSGKSTLIKSLDKRNMNVISTGDIMKSIVNDYFNIDIDRDKVKYTNWELYEPYVTSQMCGMIDLNSKDYLMLDSHYTSHHEGSFIPAFSNGSINYIGKMLQSKGYERCKCLLIETSIEELYARIKGDKSRSRGEDITYKFLEEETTANREYHSKMYNILNKYIPTEKLIISNINIEVSKKDLSDIVR